MGQVLIRNLDDDVIDRFRTKAQLNGHSLEQELRNALVASAPLTREERGALFEQLQSRSPDLTGFDVRAAIRYGRDDEFDE